MAESLTELCKELKGRIPERERCYRVYNDDLESFVVARSPGQAAMQVLRVERCPDKDVTRAALEALAELAQVEEEAL